MKNGSEFSISGSILQPNLCYFIQGNYFMITEVNLAVYESTCHCCVSLLSDEVYYCERLFDL